MVGREPSTNVLQGTKYRAIERECLKAKAGMDLILKNALDNGTSKVKHLQNAASSYCVLIIPRSESSRRIQLTVCTENRSNRIHNG